MEELLFARIRGDAVIPSKRVEDARSLIHI